jgi:hypothetical protein
LKSISNDLSDMSQQTPINFYVWGTLPAACAIRRWSAGSARPAMIEAVASYPEQKHEFGYDASHGEDP